MKDTDKLQLKKGDYFILAGVVLAVIVLLVLMAGMQQGNQVHVTVGDRTTTYSLLENRRISISNHEQGGSTPGEDYIVNTIVIEERQVYMEYASCPDQICVKHKPISKNGEMLICLPNQVFVEVENDMDNEIDN